MLDEPFVIRLLIPNYIFKFYIFVFFYIKMYEHCITSIVTHFLVIPTRFRVRCFNEQCNEANLFCMYTVTVPC